MINCLVVGERSLFKCRQERLELAPESFRPSSRVFPEELEEVLESIVTVDRGTRCNVKAPDPVPGTGSIGDLVCVCSDALAVCCVVDEVGSIPQLLLRNDFSGAVEEGPLREAGRARLRVPDEVGLVCLRAGITLPR